MRLLWTDNARSDIYKICDQLDLQLPGRGDAVLDQIIDAPIILLEHPFLGSSAGAQGYRKCVVSGTPLILLYRTALDGVEILRVVDARSDWHSLL
jgi:plasmid stabilization system protein ParE